MIFDDFEPEALLVVCTFIARSPTSYNRLELLEAHNLTFKETS